MRLSVVLTSVAAVAAADIVYVVSVGEGDLPAKNATDVLKETVRLVEEGSTEGGALRGHHHNDNNNHHHHHHDDDDDDDNEYKDCALFFVQNRNQLPDYSRIGICIGICKRFVKDTVNCPASAGGAIACTIAQDGCKVD